MIRANEFRARASAAQTLMTAGRNKTEPLGATVKTYLKKWAQARIYNRKFDEIEATSVQKGNMMEEQALAFANFQLAPNEFWEKNEQRFASDLLEGTPDIITPSCIVDIKCPVSWATYPLLETELPEPAYQLQMQVYMHLTGKRMAYVVYCLMDTPDELLLKEARSATYRTGEMLETAFDRLKKNLTYSDVPDHLKIKAFRVDYDPAQIAALEARVIECREWLAQFDTIQSV
jgi:hypothetical protein